MIAPVPPWPLFSAFLLASLVLAITPGPGVLYIVTRSLAQGRHCGLVSVAGAALRIALGALFVAIAAVTDSAYALAAGTMSPKLRGNVARRVARRFGGSVFIGLGVLAALGESRGPN